MGVDNGREVGPIRGRCIIGDQFYFLAFKSYFKVRVIYGKNYDTLWNKRENIIRNENVSTAATLLSFFIMSFKQIVVFSFCEVTKELHVNRNAENLKMR